MNATPQDLKTYRAWQREGRVVRKGESARFYLVNDDRTSGRGLFDLSQTGIAAELPDVNEREGWTLVISAEEWETLQAERKELGGRHRVKIRRPDAGGVAIWCGPDRHMISLLRAHGYKYDPHTRYWVHPNKDAETVARALENGKLDDGKRITVNRDFDSGPGPDAPVI